MFNNDNYDPYEEGQATERMLKFLFFILQIGFLCSKYFRPYVLLFWLGGFLAIVLRAYLSIRDKKGNKKILFIQEIGCAWQSGEFSMYILMFWPFSLLFLFFECLFHKDISFSRSYGLAKCFTYNSGKGKYYGMRTETAYEWSQQDIQEAQQDALESYKKAEHLTDSAKEQSRIAIIYTSIIAFLTIPVNWFRSYEQSSKDIIFTSSAVEGSVEKKFFDFEALVDNSFDLLLRLLKKFFIFFVAIISFQQKMLPVRRILWNLTQPIRAIPIEWLGVTNQINAPPLSVLINLFQTRTLILGGSNENQNFKHRYYLFNAIFNSSAAS